MSKPPGHGGLHAVVLLLLTCGPLACAYRLEAARWQPVTVPGVCKVTIGPYGSVLSYEASGRLLSAVKGAGQQEDAAPGEWPSMDWERFQYDAQGRLTEVLSGKQEGEPGETYGEFVYGLRDLQRIRFFYDAQGRLVRKESCTDAFRQEPGKTSAWTAPYGRCHPSVTEYTYDEAGRPAAAVYRGKTLERWVYEEGRPVVVHAGGHERVSLTYDASGYVVEVRRELCDDGRDCKPVSESRYLYDITGRLVEEVRDYWNDPERIQSYFRWEYPLQGEPSFKLTNRAATRRYGNRIGSREFEVDNFVHEVMEVTYDKGRLARVSSHSRSRNFTYAYEGQCENVRVADERYFTPDVPGSLHAAPCFRSPRGYYSTCVWTW